MDTGKIIAHIPARGGSKRVPAKNLRLLAGKPMIAYAIEAALKCSELHDVYVNTDSDDIEKLSHSLNCHVYRRPAELGSDTASGDDFTIDFINAKDPDTLVLINPVCPLITSEDISRAIQAYSHNATVDTLISGTETRMQTFCDGAAINIVPDGPLAPTQDNPPVFICNWAIAIWNARVFRELYQEFGGGYCGRNRLFWPMDPWRAVKVSIENDFIMAEKLLSATQCHTTENTESIRYWTPSMNNSTSK
ncbi:cytidylyltransferase domain-containing protein [Chrysiogenes arsenatis]|uniref:acylneuraminate cytidylyltransferase family protein n=1 Tax=Chrysiogenes arsenatis TaxID=309797 RepID=UPI0004058F4F|nr:acylneuraminate cytidylyltransferase family protein [Chrysiogenes arsenatis]